MNNILTILIVLTGTTVTVDQLTEVYTSAHKDLCYVMQVKHKQIQQLNEITGDQYLYDKSTLGGEDADRVAQFKKDCEEQK